MFNLGVLSKALLFSKMTMAPVRSVVSALLLSSVMTTAFALEKDSNLTDPTQPPININLSQSVQPGTDYKVSQIYTSKKTKMAIINGQKVKVGDWIEGAEVVLIKPDRVHLLVDETLKEITIMPSIKQYQQLKETQQRKAYVE